jgi:hypothetical protein
VRKLSDCQNIILRQFDTLTINSASYSCVLGVNNWVASCRGDSASGWAVGHGRSARCDGDDISHIGGRVGHNGSGKKNGGNGETHFEWFSVSEKIGWITGRVYRAKEFLKIFELNLGFFKRMDDRSQGR